jgi:integrase
MAVKKHLTDRTLKALKPAPDGKRYILWDSQVPGFGIRVGDNASDERKGSFVLVARFPGSSNSVPRRIGDYPGMALADARQIAREWREDLSKGVDPKAKEAERRRQEHARRADTFEAAFGAYAKLQLSRLRTGRSVVQAMERVMLPRFGDWPLTDIRRRHILSLAQELAIEAPISANRILAYTKTFFHWCVDTDRLETSPAADIKRPTPEKERARERVLTDAEIRAIWHACEGTGVFGRAVRLLLATGQRRGEVAGMRWSELDLPCKLWTLSGTRTKAKRAHEVPLSRLAYDILQECSRTGASEYVLATGRPSKGSAENVGCAPSGWSKAKARIDRHALDFLQKEAQACGETGKVELAEWHIHDLRRTCATNLAKLGVNRVVIALILNHAEQAVTSIYDRHRYDTEKRHALDLWADRLQSIVDGGAKVTPLRAIGE